MKTLLLQKRKKSIKNNHLGLSQRKNFWVYVTTRYRGSFCLQARFRQGWIQHLVLWDLPSCFSSPSVPCQPASPTAPKVVTGWVLSPWLEESSALLSHLPTPGIRGEVNSMIIIMGERKGRSDFPGDRRTPEPREGTWMPSDKPHRCAPSWCRLFLKSKNQFLFF